MIHAVTFTNRYGRSLRCVLAAPERSNFAIESIDGLGPGAATVNIHDIVTADGGYFGSARFSSRNIVVKFVLTEFDAAGNYIPIEKTRHLSYEFFAPKTPVWVLVETDERILTIQGYVESNEPMIFSSRETVTVSILCPGYYFKMVNEGNDVQIIRLYGNGLFQFPFSNEDLTRKLIQFGEVTNDEKYQLYYDGDAENGFTLDIAFTGQTVTGTIVITNRPLGNSDKGPIGYLLGETPSGLNTIDPSVNSSYISINMTTLATKLASVYASDLYTDGNHIIICTVPGKKSARFIANGVPHNILGYLPHLEWLKIHPGYNEFEIQTDAASAGHFYVSAEFECLYSGA